MVPSVGKREREGVEKEQSTTLQKKTLGVARAEFPIFLDFDFSNENILFPSQLRNKNTLSIIFHPEGS